MRSESWFEWFHVLGIIAEPVRGRVVVGNHHAVRSVQGLTSATYFSLISTGVSESHLPDVIPHHSCEMPDHSSVVAETGLIVVVCLFGVPLITGFVTCHAQ